MPSNAPQNPTDPLVLPIDRHILDTLSTGRRQTPKNLAAIITTDDTRNYIGNRLRTLEKRGYLHSPGPADRSGMYEITSWGRAAHHHLPEYDRGYDTLFHELVKRIVDSQPDPDRAPPGHYPNTPHPAPDPRGDTHTDWIQLTETEITALKALSSIEGITIPSDFTDHISVETGEAADILYTLHFFGFADRRDGMDAYSASDTARDLFRSDAADAISSALARGIQRSGLIDQFITATQS